MLPKYHILFGFVFVIFLFFVFPTIPLFGLAIIFLSSFLIDVDHVLYYFLRKRNLNPFKAYRWYMERRKDFCRLSKEQRKNFYSGFYLFHGIEILAILFFLGIYFPIMFFIFLGFSLHLFIDIIYEIYDKETIDKFSLIWNYHRFKISEKN